MNDYIESAARKINAVLNDNYKVLFGIFLLAFCVRVVYAVYFVGLQVILPGDAEDFLEYADNLVAGRGYNAWGYQAFRPPGYSVFLAAVFYVFGRSYAVVKIIQCLISSLIPVMMCLIGFKFTSRKIAVAAGLYACFYYGLILEPSTIMSEATFTFLFTLTVLLFLSAREKIAYGVAAGVTLALMILTRPVGLLTLPLFFLWLYIVLERGRFLRVALAVAVACVATMAPWWLRNYRIYDKFVPVCLETGGVIENLHIPKGTWPASRYENLSEYEKDRLKTHDGLECIKQAGPAAFLKGALARMVTFFYPFVPAYDITWFLMFPFWLIGMYVILRQRNKQAYILFNLCIYFPIYFFFCATTRYKYSISPFMILFASAGLFYLLEKYRDNRRVYAVLLGWILANGVVWLNAPWFRAIALKAKGS